MWYKVVTAILENFIINSLKVHGYGKSFNLFYKKTIKVIQISEWQAT